MKKVKESREKRTSQTDKSMVITREKGVWGEVEEGKVGINDDGRRLDLG